ncbi:unnamed protein product [Urochloa humidicola]
MLVSRQAPHWTHPLRVASSSSAPTAAHPLRHAPPTRRRARRLCPLRAHLRSAQCRPSPPCAPHRASARPRARSLPHRHLLLLLGRPQMGAVAAERSELTCNGRDDFDGILPRKRAHVAPELVECGDGQQGCLVLPLALAAARRRPAAVREPMAFSRNCTTWALRSTHLFASRLRGCARVFTRRGASTRAVVAAVERAAVGRLQVAEANLECSRCRNAELEWRRPGAA